MKIINVSIVLGLILLLAGCKAPPAPEDIVAERAQARWDALVARDFDAAYNYHSPGFRAQTPASSFAALMLSRPIRWDDAEVLSVECAEDTCTVTVSITYTAVGAPGVLADIQNERPLSETWLKLDKDWWFSAQD